MSTKPIQGGCVCDSVRYEATGKPHDVTHCHCEDCRRNSGAPFVTWASYRRSDFRFTKGEPKEIQWAGRIRAFCPQCGTPLIFLSGPNANEVGVTVCSLDHPEGVTPEDHTWVVDRLPWIVLADGLPYFQQDRKPQ